MLFSVEVSFFYLYGTWEISRRIFQDTSLSLEPLSLSLGFSPPSDHRGPPLCRRNSTTLATHLAQLVEGCEGVPPGPLSAANVAGNSRELRSNTHSCRHYFLSGEVPCRSQKWKTTTWF